MKSISLSFGGLAAVVLGLGLQVLNVGTALAERPLVKSTFDPNAEQVEMFEAMAQGTLDVKMVAKDARSGFLFISNKQEIPVNVKVPEGFVGVPVLAQFGGGALGGAGASGLNQGGAGGGGAAQSTGGGMGGMGGGGMGGMGGGMGMFSIPAEKTLRVPFQSVCLEYGKPEPGPRTPMAVIPIEEYTNNPVLENLIKMVGSGTLETGAAQAAAWNVASDKSWEELAALKYDRVATANDPPQFSRGQLQAAQMIVTSAEQKAAESPATEKNPANVPVRQRRVK